MDNLKSQEALDNVFDLWKDGIKLLVQVRDECKAPGSDNKISDHTKCKIQMYLTGIIQGACEHNWEAVEQGYDCGTTKDNGYFEEKQEIYQCSKCLMESVRCFTEVWDADGYSKYRSHDDDGNALDKDKQLILHKTVAELVVECNHTK